MGNVEDKKIEQAAREAWESYRISHLPYTTHFTSSSFERAYVAGYCSRDEEFATLLKSVSSITLKKNETISYLNQLVGTLKSQLAVKDSIIKIQGEALESISLFKTLSDQGLYLTASDFSIKAIEEVVEILKREVR